MRRACAAFSRAASASSCDSSSVGEVDQVEEVSHGSLEVVSRSRSRAGPARTYDLRLGLSRRQQHFLEDVAAVVDLLVGERQRRQQAQDRLVRAVDEQPASAGTPARPAAPSMASSTPIIAPLTRTSVTSGHFSLSATKRARNRSPICVGAVEQAVGLDRLDGRQGGAGRRAGCRRTSPRACRA